jgi:coenzyme F420-0:L-glutamate ligase/coenzyme F420-1:gamma-L-glutamate ligase
MVFSCSAVPGIGEVQPGDDLARLIGDALDGAGLALQRRDVVVVAQKIVSKAENRFVCLDAMLPSARARALAAATGKDARLVEAILRDSSAVVRHKPGVLIARHRLGYVMAQAGIDRSNLGPGGAGDGERVLLLPEDCDASAAALRDGLGRRFGVAVGVIVSDSFGRPWRRGTVNVALGVAGLPALIDRRGERDRDGAVLAVTEPAFADAIAAAAGLVMGEGGEGLPVVLARGLDWSAADSTGMDLLRPPEEDLFR